MLNIIKLKDDLGACLAEAFAVADLNHQQGRYLGVSHDRVLDAYNKAKAHNLRYDRKANVMRDNRLGVLSSPSDPSQWEEATIEDARYYLAREVWCSAVGQYNRDTL